MVWSSLEGDRSRGGCVCCVCGGVSGSLGGFAAAAHRVALAVGVACCVFRSWSEEVSK